MAAKKKQTVLSTLIGIVVVLTFLWSRYQEASDGQGLGLSQLVEAEVLGDTLSASPSAPQGGPTLRQVQLLSTHYQVWDDCVMVDHRGNDGDSFHIQAPHGREEVRIYYVDAPESAARSYRDGNTNHLRIAQQGAAMGGLDQAETTRVGLKAKAFVKQLLDGFKELRVNPEKSNDLFVVISTGVAIPCNTRFILCNLAPKASPIA